MNHLHNVIYFSIIIYVKWIPSISSSPEELKIDLNINEDLKRKGKQSHYGLDYHRGEIIVPGEISVKDRLTEVKDVNEKSDSRVFKGGIELYDTSILMERNATSGISGPQPNKMLAIESRGTEFGNETKVSCDCVYASGGCVMAPPPPPKGWACKCYNWFIASCRGDPWKCAQGQQCPGNCMDVSCCKNGNGNCGGYGK